MLDNGVNVEKDRVYGQNALENIELLCEKFGLVNDTGKGRPANMGTSLAAVNIGGKVHISGSDAAETMGAEARDSLIDATGRRFACVTSVAAGDVPGLTGVSLELTGAALELTESVVNISTIESFLAPAGAVTSDCVVVVAIDVGPGRLLTLISSRRFRIASINSWTLSDGITTLFGGRVA